MAPLPLEAWRDFYVMIGTASGAIVGATFVVASLASGMKERTLGIRGFVSPTAVHLGSVLIGSAIMAVPAITAIEIALLLGLGGFAGAIYGIVVATRIWSLNLDIADRVFYVCLPIVAYAMMLGAAIMLVLQIDSPLHVLAASLVLLLIAGMRNAWDMASFMILRREER